jgi:hypothetical protein
MQPLKHAHALNCTDLSKYVFFFFQRLQRKWWKTVKPQPSTAQVFRPSDLRLVITWFVVPKVKLYVTKMSVASNIGRISVTVIILPYEFILQRGINPFFKYVTCLCQVWGFQRHIDMAVFWYAKLCSFVGLIFRVENASQLIVWNVDTVYLTTWHYVLKYFCIFTVMCVYGTPRLRKLFRRKKN